MNHYLSLILGVGCAAAGGELFVRGAVGIAKWARISSAIIGATVAAFATSSPELSVAVSAALKGKPEISLGDAVGSNVVNIALVLGIALCISGIQGSHESVKRDFRVALFVPIITGLLFIDGRLSRLDGVVMLCMFVAWIVASVLEARKQRRASEKTPADPNHWKMIAACALGLGFLIAAGNLIVAGAKGIAASFGISDFIIGATVVSIGTSMPELATTLIAKLRGHDEIGLGTILGSNIFNGVFIVAVAAIICPIVVAWNDILVALLSGLLAVLFLHPNRKNFIPRYRGIGLLLLYAAYVYGIAL
jgi:cation:H+ antiporter